MIRQKNRFLLLVLLPILLLASCSREIMPESPAGSEEQAFTTIHFRATATDGSGTKASVSYGQYIFKDGDRLFVSYNDGQEVKMYGFLTLVFGFDTPTGVFEGDLLCADDFTPTDNTPLDAILVSENDQIHTWANGQVTGTSWPTDVFATSFEDAVERFSDFRASATYGNPVFHLNQNSSFLIFEVSLLDVGVSAGDVLSVKLFNNNSPTPIISGDVTAVSKNLTVQAELVAVFEGGTVNLSGATLDLKKKSDNSDVYTIPDIRNAALASNNYYTVSRSTLDLLYFTIQAAEEGETTITFNYNTGILKYSKNNDNSFTSYTGPITLQQGEYIQLISTGTSYYNSSSDTPLFTSGGKLCYIYGDLMSLMCTDISDIDTKKTTVAADAFHGAFLNATYIEIPAGRPLKLSATTLGNNCYQEMFQGCTALTRPPVLPATSIPASAYRNMFNGCTALTEAPELPAITNIGNSGCLGMFNGCTAMRSAPTSVATADATLGQSACYWMFIDCSSLLNAPALPALSVPVSGYYQMFSGCTSLTAAPELPATTVGNSSYYGMFSGCTALLTAPPQLPASAVGESSYKQMFSGCTALTNTPEDLPATTGANSCYQQMFDGCISISASPRTISLTSIGTNGCYQMFSGCTSLVSAPNMNSVSSVGNYGCYMMFYGCGELRELLERNDEPFSLNATSAPTYAYYRMFYGCAKLTTAPDIIATTVGTYACTEMFRGCTRLTTPPSTLGAETVSSNAYNGMFYGCSSLTSAPSLPNVTSVATNGCYRMFYECARLASFTGLSSCATIGSSSLREMFYNCVLLTSGPDLFSVTSVENSGCYGMFQNCIRLQTFTGLASCTTVGNNGFQNMFYECQMVNSAINLTALATIGTSSCQNMFYNCKRLAATSATLPTALASSCYRGMYKGCSSLTSVPEHLLSSTTLAENCYYEMFMNCTSLTSTPTLPATTLTANCYYQMFRGCTSLTSAPDLPATTLASSCYQGMFNGCTLLASAPDLPATTLQANCYYQMFYGCTALTSAPVLPALALVGNCYSEMFRNCSSLVSVTCLATSGINTSGSTTNWLNGVPNTAALHGTFTRNPAANVSSNGTGSGDTWPRSANGIPDRWIIEVAGLQPIFPDQPPFNNEEEF